MVMNGVMKQFVECCFFQKVTRLLSRNVLRVCQGPLATSKAITAKNVTFKKSLRFSNFFYRDYFNSLKTSNICKFSGIEFLGPNPKLRRRKKNLSWCGYSVHKTFLSGNFTLQSVLNHVQSCCFANLSLPSPSL